MPDIFGGTYSQAPQFNNEGIKPLTYTPQPIAPVTKETTDVDRMKASHLQFLKGESARGADLLKPAIRTPWEIRERYSDPEIGYDATNPELEQIYADNQGVFSRLGSRLAKTGANAGVAFLDTFISTGNFLLGNENVDSPLITSMNDWLENVDRKYLPNYVTRYQKENPLLSYFTPWNFTSWIDSLGEVTQNLGYTVGAIGASLVMDIPIAAVTGGIGEAVLLPAQLAKITSKFGKLSRIITEGGENYAKFRTILSEADDAALGMKSALNKFDDVKKWTDTGRFLTSTAISAYGESIVEANNNYRELKKSLEESMTDSSGTFRGTAEDLQRIEELALQSGKATVAPNFAFLAISNGIGLGSVLRPSQAAVKATQKAMGKRVAVEVANPNLVKSTVTPYSKGFKGLGERLMSPASIFKDNIREGIEEGYQFVVSDAAKHHYERQFKADPNNRVFSMTEDYMQSLGNLFSTEEGQKSMLLGFLGGVFQGGIRNYINNKRGVLSGQALANNITQNLNTYSTTAIFNANRNEAVTATDILAQMENAAATGDIMKYKNLQLEALFNWVNSGVKTNNFQARLEQLESMKGLDKESFETMFGLSLDENSKKTVDNYIDAVKNKAIAIKNNIEKVDNAFGKNPFNYKKDPIRYEAYQSYKGELAVSLSQIDDFRRRVADIKQSTYEKIPGNFEEVLALSDARKMDKVREKLEEELKDVQNSEQLAEGNKAIQQPFTERRKFLEERLAAFDNNYFETAPDEFIREIRELYKYYGNNKDLKGTFDISELDTLNVFNNLQDYYSLLEETSKASNYYSSLTKKDGFDIFEKEYTRNVGEYLDNLEITEEGVIVIKKPEPEQTEEEVSQEKKEKAQEIITEVGAASVEELRDMVEEGTVVMKEGKLSKVEEGEQVTEEQKEEAASYVEWLMEPEKTTVPVGETVRDKANSLPQDDEDLDLPFDTKPKQKEDVEDKTLVEKVVDFAARALDSFWKSFPFKPYNAFNKANSFKVEDDDNLGNLISVIRSNSPKDIIKTITFKITDVKASGKTIPYPLYQKDGTPRFTKLVAKGVYTKNVEVYFKSRKIAILQDPDRVGYVNEDGKYIPLGDVTDPALYAELTLNPASTFEAFMKQHNAYKQAYLEVVKSGKKSFTNEEVLNLFEPVINFGEFLPTTNKEAYAKSVESLKLWKGSGVIRIDPDESITVLNSDKLTKAEMAELSAFLEKDSTKRTIKNSKQQYFVISKLPDGTFSDKLSIIYARPKEFSVEGDLFETVTKDGDINLEGVVVTKANSSVGTTRIFFNKNEDDSISVRIVNNKLSVNKTYQVEQETLLGLGSSTGMANFMTDIIKQTGNPALQAAKLQITPADFKVTKVDADYGKNLSAAVTTEQIYANYSINFYPKPAEAAPVQKPKEEEQPTPKEDEVNEPVVDDEQALQELNDKIDDLNALIEEADDAGNEARATNLRMQREDLYNKMRVIINKKKEAVVTETVVPNENLIDTNFASIVAQLEKIKLITRTGC